MLSGTCKYVIELRHKSALEPRVEHVIHELIKAGHAQGTQEYHKVTLNLFKDSLRE